jgi:hypothetical protein
LSFLALWCLPHYRRGETRGPCNLLYSGECDREPLHRQLASELKRLILAQTIASGARLPSSRVYAEELGVSF